MKESFVFSELIRKFNNIIRFGTVVEIDHKKARIKVKTGKITTNWIPWLTTAGSIKIWNPPVLGEQVTLLSQGGDLAVSVAIPSIYRDRFTAPSDDENVFKIELSDKSSIEFNKSNNSIKIRVNEAEISINEDEIKLSVGHSNIEITPEKIGLYAPIIDAPNLRIGS